MPFIGQAMNYERGKAMESLGKIIGIVNDSFVVTNDQGDKVEVTCGYDVTNASDDVIKSWIAADRRIKYQAVLRKKTAAEIRALNGQKVVFDGARARAPQVDPITAILNAANAEGISVEEYLKKEVAKRGHILRKV